MEDDPNRKRRVIVTASQATSIKVATPQIKPVRSGTLRRAGLLFFPPVILDFNPSVSQYKRQSQLPWPCSHFHAERPWRMRMRAGLIFRGVIQVFASDGVEREFHAAGNPE